MNDSTNAEPDENTSAIPTPLDAIKHCGPLVFDGAKGQLIAHLGTAVAAQVTIVDINVNNGTLTVTPDPDIEAYNAWLNAPPGNPISGCSTGYHHHAHVEVPTPPGIAWQYPVPSGDPRINSAHDMKPPATDGEHDKQ